MTNISNHCYHVGNLMKCHIFFHLLHLENLFSLPSVSFVFCALCRYQCLDEEVQHLDIFLSPLWGLWSQIFAQNCGFVIFKKVDFIKFKLLSSPESTKKFECWPRPVHPLSVQHVIPSCNSPFTYDFLFFCLPILASVAPLSACLSVCLSVCLSLFQSPCRLLVELSVRLNCWFIRLPACLLEFLFLCWDVGFTIIVCLLARTSVFPS